MTVTSSACEELLFIRVNTIYIPSTVNPSELQWSPLKDQDVRFPGASGLACERQPPQRAPSASCQQPGALSQQVCWPLSRLPVPLFSAPSWALVALCHKVALAGREKGGPISSLLCPLGLQPLWVALSSCTLRPLAAPGASPSLLFDSPNSAHNSLK